MAPPIKVLVPLASGFEEIEAVTIIDVLRRAGLYVCIAGIKDNLVEGAHGIRIETNTVLQDAGRDWDAVVLPGGIPGAENLRDSDLLCEIIAEVSKAGNTVAAVCAGPIALERAGVLKGLRATGYPGFDKQLTSAIVVDEKVVEDGNVITSRAPGTAMPFALAVVRRLVGDEMARRLEEGMLITVD